MRPTVQRFDGYAWPSGEIGVWRRGTWRGVALYNHIDAGVRRTRKGRNVCFSLWFDIVGGWCWTRHGFSTPVFSVIWRQSKGH